MERGKDKGMTVGFTSVVGDLFHAGHVAMIQDCRLFCDYLIVAVMAGVDDRVGKNKPVQSLFERFFQVANCKGVDEVVACSDEKDLELAIRTYGRRIDVRFVGSDYIGREFTGKKACEELGIRLIYNQRGHGLSTSELRGRVCNAK